MKVDELRVLETVNKVTDFVQVQLSDPSFTSLRYLRNLRIIQGQHTTQYLFTSDFFIYNGLTSVCLGLYPWNVKFSG